MFWLFSVLFHVGPDSRYCLVYDLVGQPAFY